jgi:hypothetical protein
MNSSASSLQNVYSRKSAVKQPTDPDTSPVNLKRRNELKAKQRKTTLLPTSPATNVVIANDVLALRVSGQTDVGSVTPSYYRDVLTAPYFYRFVTRQLADLLL